MPPATANFATRENRCRSRETSDHNNNPMPPIPLARRRGSSPRNWIGFGQDPRCRRFRTSRAHAYPAESRGLSLRDWERVPAFNLGDFAVTPTGQGLGSSSNPRCYVAPLFRCARSLKPRPAMDFFRDDVATVRMSQCDASVLSARHGRLGDCRQQVARYRRPMCELSGARLWLRLTPPPVENPSPAGFDSASRAYRSAAAIAVSLPISVRVPVPVACLLPAIAPVPDRRVFGCHKGGRGLAHRIGASTVRAIFR